MIRQREGETGREFYARLDRRRVRFNTWIGLPMLAVCLLALIITLAVIVIAEPLVLVGVFMWAAMMYVLMRAMCA